MTIHEVFLVWGIRVERSDYKKIMGYTYENYAEKYGEIDPELIGTYIKEEDKGKYRCLECTKLFVSDEYIRKHINTRHDDLILAQRKKFIRDSIDEWFYEEHFDGGIALAKRFQLNGVDFIAREITHDREYAGDFIVGLDMGSVVIDDGEQNVTTPDKDLLNVLLKDEKWARFAIEIDEDYESQVWCTTDDCACCS